MSRTLRSSPASEGRRAYIAASKELDQGEWEIFEQASAEFDRVRERSVGNQKTAESPAEG